MKEAVRELVAGHGFVAGLPAGAVDLLASRAEYVAFEPGSLLLREGDPATAAYLITQGSVALEVYSPNRVPLLIETIGAGHVVGLSWAAPPFRSQFDACAVDDVEAVAIDTEALRASLAAHPELGYLVLDRLTSVMLGRLQATRMRLLDVYGRNGH